MKLQEITIRDERQRKSVVNFLSVVSVQKPIKVTIETLSEKRTLRQNALMWKWINEVADAAADYSGHTADEMHEFFKHKFLSPHVIEINGEIVNHFTTTKLSKPEMSNYMERIYQFVTADLGLYLTLPEELMAR